MLLLPLRNLRALGALPLLLLGGCFDMPHPFADPGEAARKLALDVPPSRLDVPTPPAALLDAPGAQAWAQAATKALLAQDIPAVAQPVRPGDWWLRLSASNEGGRIVPHYAIMTPEGKPRGTQDGAAMAPAQWSHAAPDLLAATSTQAAPGLVAMLTGIHADVMAHDPHSLMRRPASIYFAGITGAPGNGAQSLRTAFLNALRDPQDVVQDAPKGADFVIHTTVKLSDARPMPEVAPVQHIEIVWHVVDAKGVEAGAATQLHDVPAHSLDADWGETADAAAQEAAGGVRQIITNYSGRADKPLPPPAR